MKSLRFFAPIAIAIVTLANSACEDAVSQIGDSIVSGEASISIDSIIFDLNATPVKKDRFDARSGSFMFGNINVPEYGELNCSFVSRFMSVTSLPAADTIPTERVDSCKLLIGVPRGNMTGDSISVQQLAVYPLNKQLPSSITNQFDPSGYYAKKDVLGSLNYTGSMLGEVDSLYYTTSGFNLSVKLPVELGRDIFTKYKESPEIFAWPQTFAQYFPGIYVKPTFGNGCVINSTQLLMVAYVHNFKTTEETDSAGNKTTKETLVRDSVLMFSATPEVLSSNNISYKVSNHIKNLISQGKTIITTPGGYEAKFQFPAKDVIERYRKNNTRLSIISNLSLSIPAEEVENEHGIYVAPYMLLIKTSEVENFFANNKIPDNKTSFYASYNAISKTYEFSELRDYLLNLLDKETITDDDIDFSLVPVLISQESVNNTYYGSTTYYVTKCVPYILAPTMTQLDTKNALVVFTFSSQVIE